MPMGFYQPAQIVGDAQKHGVEVRPVDINLSGWDHKLEERSGPYCALRLGFRQVKGMREEDIQLLLYHRKNGYKNVDELRRTGLSPAALQLLADADAFRSVGLDRRQALWQIATKDLPVALFEGQENEDPTKAVSLPRMSESEHVVYDYETTSLSLKAHPVSFVREKLHQLHILSTKDLSSASDGAIVKVAGLVLVRQRPGTAGGICFMTIEDETGFANLVIFASLFETFRKPILQSRLIMVEGKLQVEGDVIHVIVRTCHDFSKLLRNLTPADKETLPLLTLARPDEKSIPPAQNKRTQVRTQTQENIFPQARNFK
jgi:error-prone DNA polymerase